MLVLSRKVGEELVIGDNIRVVINRVAGNRVAVAIEAPEHVSIVRGELVTLRQQFADPADTLSDPDDAEVGCYEMAGSGRRNAR